MDTDEKVRLLIMSGLPGPPHRRNRRFVRVLFAIILVAGCRSRVLTVKPSIEVTRIPMASIGGPDEMDDIEGHVRNAKPGQQIVIYAHSGVWWIQPFINQPFTRIESDGAWKSSTHLGTEYAALLVDEGYRPASKIVALPPEGSGVAALAVARGKTGTLAPAALIHFSGYDWGVRTSESDHGGEPNAYDAAN